MNRDAYLLILKDIPALFVAAPPEFRIWSFHFLISSFEFPFSNFESALSLNPNP